ncbi:MAG: DUF2889 domain-containing protein [Actinomycetota bacterium]|nr:DUF2889 domain-containing protein [Actinomycetota bacterium]
MTRIPVHKRSLDIEIFDDEQGFTVLGHLTDRRPWHDDPSRQVLHDMTIELGIDPATLTITSATSQMSAFPHAECPLVTMRFGNLVGLSVGRGYSKALRDVFGGVTGCAHVYELARTAGAAVVQGNLSRQAKKAHDTGTVRNIDPDRLKAMMAGTCHVWAVDGVAPAKLDLGWRPAGVFPVPSLEQLRDQQGS